MQRNIRLLKDQGVKRISGILLGLSFLMILIIVVGLCVKSQPLFEHQSLIEVLLGTVWSPLKGYFGFLPFIIGTISVTLIALIIAVPLCVSASVYLVEYASVRVRHIVLPLVNILAAIPPVLYGVWGILFVVPLIGDYLAPIFGISTTGYSILAGGVVLAVMVFPIMVSIMVEVLKTIPQDLRAVSLSLGATRLETVQHVLLRKAKPGIVAAIVLAISRAFGETIAVLMVCGNIPQLPQSLFDSGYPLPALIANNFGEMMSIPLYDSALMFAALLLLVIILGFNVVSRGILKRMEEIDQ